MFNGFAKSPSATFRSIPALLNSRYARRQSRFNRVNHCDVRTWRRTQGARLREIGFALFRLLPWALRLDPFCVRLIPQDLHALHLELFALPCIFGVLRGDDA
jgi:hypothetical protein